MFLFFISLIFSCTLFDNPDSCRISIRATMEDQSRAYDLQVVSVSLTVSASDMNTINFTTSRNSINLSVPKGPKRTFKISVEYSDGRVYEGISTVDLINDNESIDILLSLVILDPPSNVFAETSTSFTKNSVNFMNPSTASIAISSSGNFLYVLYEEPGYNGFDVFDVSQPLLPVHVGFMATPDRCSKIVSFSTDLGLVSERNYVYLALDIGNGASELIGFEVTDPGAITQFTITQPFISGSPRDLFFNETQSVIYMLTDDNTSSFSLANPSSPGFINYIQGDIADASRELNGKSGFMYKGAQDEFFASGLGYLERYTDGVVMSQPENYAVVANDGTDISFDGRYVYIVGSSVDDNNNGFVIVDTFKSNPADRIVSSVPLFYSSVDVLAASSHKGIEVYKNIAFISDNAEGLKAYFVYDRSNPTLIDSLSISGGTNDILLSGDYLFVTSISDGKVYIIKHYLNS